MNFRVALKKSKEGKTEREALDNIQSAIQEYLETVAIVSKGSKIREVEVLV